MNLLCASWETVGNTTGESNLNDLIDTTGFTSITEGMEVGDYVTTWDMEAGDWGNTYSYVNLDMEGYRDTWLNGQYQPTAIMMVPGSSFWLYHKGEDLIGVSFAGQVASGTHGYTLTGGKMNLCGNPYPTTLDLTASAGQVTITGATSITESMEVGDYITTWDVEEGDWGNTFSYVNLDMDGYRDAWLNGQYQPASTDIKPGAGFWYYAKGDNVTLTFTQIND